jgi:hypothetical protein
MGWALAQAWQNGAYFRLGLTYLIASGLHGLWNTLGVLYGLGALLEDAPDSLRGLTWPVALVALVVLIFLLLLLLWGSNRQLQKELRPLEAPALPDSTQPT